MKLHFLISFQENYNFKIRESYDKIYLLNDVHDIVWLSDLNTSLNSVLYKVSCIRGSSTKTQATTKMTRFVELISRRIYITIRYFNCVGQRVYVCNGEGVKGSACALPSDDAERRLVQCYFTLRRSRAFELLENRRIYNDT